MSFNGIQKKYIETLIPFEIYLYKSKNSARFISQYCVLSGSNLKIYPTLGEIKNSLVELQANSKELKNRLDTLNVSNLNLDIDYKNLF